jgi:hypothetical protein
MVWWEAVAQVSLAELRCAQGRHEEATACLVPSIAAFESLSDKRWTAIATVVAVRIEVEGNPLAPPVTQLARLDQATGVLLASRDAIWAAKALDLTAKIHQRRGDLAAAERAAQQAAEIEHDRLELAQAEGPHAG